MSDIDLPSLMRIGGLMTSTELSASGPLTFRESVEALWKAGLPRGDRTGWPSVDELYTVAPGQFTVLTGWPSSGKSEWLDQLLLNLARQGWRHCIFSPENQPTSLHIAKLIEKFMGKPFRTGPTERLSQDEVVEAMTEMQDWFGFLTPPADTDRSGFGIQEILNAAEVHFRMAGLWHDKEAKKGLVIDPWNEIEHAQPQGITETNYISQVLQFIRQWARTSRTHVWIVAHPQKVRREDGKLPIPRPDMISGSQHWWNKADCCVTVYRDFEKEGEIDVHVQKCRFKHIGKIGVASLNYDRTTGRYAEPRKSIERYAGQYRGDSD